VPRPAAMRRSPPDSGTREEGGQPRDLSADSAELAVLQRVERDGEGDHQAAVDITQARLEREHVPVAEGSEHALVPADLVLPALQHEVERQVGEEVEPA